MFTTRLQQRRARRRLATVVIAVSALGLSVGGVVAANAQDAANTEDVPSAAPEAKMLTGPLHTSLLPDYYFGIWHTDAWYLNRPTPQDVSYPAPGETGVVSIGGTCVSKNDVGGENATIVHGSSSDECMSFLAEVIDEGSIAFQVVAPGSPVNGHYLADGDNGGILDLIDRLPEMLFVAPEEPSAELASAGSVVDVDEDGVVSTADSVVFTATVTNTGNVALRGPSVTDSRGLEYEVHDIAAGETATFTSKPAPLTQAEIDAGVAKDEVSFAAKTPQGTDVTAGPSAASVSIAATTSLSSSVVSDADESTVVGDTITYTVMVKNGGTVTASGVHLDGASCADAALAPGASTSCTATHVVTQADVEAGQVVASFAGSAKAPNGDALTIPAASVTDMLVQTSSLSSSIASDADEHTVVGDTITYTVTVTNTGTVTASDVAVPGATCADAVLAPGAATSCTATHVVTQADVDAGQVAVSFAGSAKAPNGDVVPVPAVSVTDMLAQTSVLSSSIVSDAGEHTVVGDTITYTVTVKNGGTVTASDVAVPGVTCVDAVLAPGASTSCTATHVVTQADVDAGQVAASFAGSATAPNGDALTIPAASVTDMLAQTSLLSSSIVSDAGEHTVVGDTITYTVTVKNTGTVTASGVHLDGATCADAVLAPGASTSCTATHVVTQADVDAGRVAASFAGSATAPNGDAIPVPKASVTDQLAQLASLEVAGVSDATTDVELGATVSYTLTVTNTGSVTLSGLALMDDLTDDAGSEAGADDAAAAAPQHQVECALDALAPGESTTCSVERTITQDDIDTGSITVTFTSEALAPGGVTTTAEALTITDAIDQRAVLEAHTRAVTTETIMPGQQARFETTITNTGNETISDIRFDDQTVSCTDQPEHLAPGASFDCRVELTATDASAVAGHLSFSPKGAGVDPAGDPAMIIADEATVPVTPTPVPAPALASTGADAAGWLALAGAALMGGLATMILARRRQNSKHLG